MKRNKLLILFCILLLAACYSRKNKNISSNLNSESQNSNTLCPKQNISKPGLKFFCENKFDFSNNLSAIFILTENGCNSCNQSFSATAKKYLIRDDVGIIVACRGAILNINPYLSQKGRSNLAFDTGNLTYDAGYAKFSGFYLLKKDRVDTCLLIKGPDLEKQLAFIDSTMKSL